MYVCLCHGITDGNVREAARGGATSAEDVFDRHGVSPCCGSCAAQVSAIVEQPTGPVPIQD